MTKVIKIEPSNYDPDTNQAKEMIIDNPNSYFTFCPNPDKEKDRLKYKINQNALRCVIPHLIGYPLYFNHSSDLEIEEKFHEGLNLNNKGVIFIITVETGFPRDDLYPVLFSDFGNVYIGRLDNFDFNRDDFDVVFDYLSYILDNDYDWNEYCDNKNNFTCFALLYYNNSIPISDIKEYKEYCSKWKIKEKLSDIEKEEVAEILRIKASFYLNQKRYITAAVKLIHCLRLLSHLDNSHKYKKAQIVYFKSCLKSIYNWICFSFYNEEPLFLKYFKNTKDYCNLDKVKCLIEKYPADYFIKNLIADSIEELISQKTTLSKSFSTLDEQKEKDYMMLAIANKFCPYKSKKEIQSFNFKNCKNNIKNFHRNDYLNCELYEKSKEMYYLATQGKSKTVEINAIGKIIYEKYGYDALINCYYFVTNSHVDKIGINKESDLRYIMDSSFEGIGGFLP